MLIGVPCATTRPNVTSCGARVTAGFAIWPEMSPSDPRALLASLPDLRYEPCSTPLDSPVLVSVRWARSDGGNGGIGRSGGEDKNCRLCYVLRPRHLPHLPCGGLQRWAAVEVHSVLRGFFFIYICRWGTRRRFRPPVLDPPKPLGLRVLPRTETQEPETVARMSCRMCVWQGI